MRRKDIENALLSWFEVTSSAVSKSLRALARPPFGMIRIVEDPNSGREKLVHLTAHGDRFLQQMIENGEVLMRDMIRDLTDEEVKSGIHFLSRVTDIFVSRSAEQTPDKGQTPKLRSGKAKKPKGSGTSE